MYPRFQIEAKSDDFDLTSGFRLIRRRIVMIVALTVSYGACRYRDFGLKPSYHAASRLIIHTPLATTLGAEDTPAAMIR